ncbi:type II secretion system F family protein [Coralliovum pocilloporae]|uniref:type II secretion system F family protein n=1 Tax=Coralliovum pocilloporae TaxID=3066369 RepID=UPI0033071D5C
MDPQILQYVVAGLTLIAVSATVLMVALPYIQGDRLQSRMKAAATERDRLRREARARLEQEEERKSLRGQESRAYMRDVVRKFNLRKALADDKAIEKLRMAGFRGEAPLTVFLFARATLPFLFFALGLVYFFIVSDLQYSTLTKFLFSLMVAYGGIFAPNLFVSNRLQKRQESIRLAWPDALDLMLICVESGMSIDVTLKRVSDEIGARSPELAEELVLTSAELSYLQDRRAAFENLGKRTGLEMVKAVMTSLMQAEKYGTSLGTSLRTMAKESRDERMTAAEKKAAALPPKLTVPMILFFMPALFAVIMGPAIIQVMATNFSASH